MGKGRKAVPIESESMGALRFAHPTISTDAAP
jgi:hypothetical protein